MNTSGLEREIRSLIKGKNKARDIGDAILTAIDNTKEAVQMKMVTILQDLFN